MIWIAILLGVVEGLTEFLPVSSTGHLIVASALVDFTGRRAEVFQIFIQLGAILAVVWVYRERLLTVVRDLPRRVASRRFGMNLFLAFAPAAIIGLMVHDMISEYLFSPLTVAIALIAGGMLILVVEGLPLRPRAETAEEISRGQAVVVGISQCLALWPGISRSAATILGGLCAGLNRQAATDFSFFLAIPVMFAATFYQLFVSRDYLEAGDAKWLSVAFVVSFMVAWAAIRWFLGYVSNHSFKVFAWYRIVFGIAVLLMLRWL